MRQVPITRANLHALEAQAEDEAWQSLGWSVDVANAWVFDAPCGHEQCVIVSIPLGNLHGGAFLN